MNTPTGTAGKYHNIAPEDRRLVSLSEAASMLSMSRTAVHTLVRDRDLEGLRSGRRLLIPVESVDAYVARLREEAAQ